MPGIVLSSGDKLKGDKAPVSLTNLACSKSASHRVVRRALNTSAYYVTCDESYEEKNSTGQGGGSKLNHTKKPI